MEKIIHLGIDVGKQGAIAALSPNGVIQTYKIPLIGKEIDLQELFNIINSYKGTCNHCVIEDVHSIFGVGAQANFQFGRALGLIEMAVKAAGIPLTKVQPKAWQKEMWQGIRPIEINTGKKTKDGNIKYKIDTKATSILAVKNLFPHVDLTKSARSKKDDDGITDAILMAEYGRRKFK